MKACVGVVPMPAQDMVHLLNLPGRVRRGRPLGSSSSSSNGGSGSGTSEEHAIRRRVQAAFPQACDDSALCSALVAAEVELARRGGFMPLMQAMPMGLESIPWSTSDRLLHAWCKARKARPAAATPRPGGQAESGTAGRRTVSAG